MWNEWVRNPKLACDKSFFELTGNVGDVFLIHPMMLHSASRNVLRNVRIINNAAVSLKVPFNYNRTDPKDYSLVEQKTLRDLGRPEGIPEWKMTGKRQLIKTENVRVYSVLPGYARCLRSLAKTGYAIYRTGATEKGRCTSHNIEGRQAARRLSILSGVSLLQRVSVVNRTSQGLNRCNLPITPK